MHRTLKFIYCNTKNTSTHAIRRFSSYTSTASSLSEQPLKLSSRDFLLDQTYTYLQFLESISDMPVLFTCNQSSMIKRYKQFTSLDKVYPTKQLIPEIDITLVWAVDLLAPRQYSTKMKSTSFVQDNYWRMNLLVSREDENYLKMSQIWNKKFGQSYNMIPDTCDDVMNHSDQILLERVRKQLKFADNIMTSFNEEITTRRRDFVEASIDRYLKFLKLIVMYPDTFLVPTVDIDIIWHSHMLE
jgi:hypothetical protein